MAILYYKRVLILPMRNGNDIFYVRAIDVKKFLSYLWGMETFFLSFFFHLYHSFLSYLWGMETQPFWLSIVLYYRSYPTYEEWKPRYTKRTWRPKPCSYPTYEEWKRVKTNRGALGVFLSSYPTYEEWKHEYEGLGLHVLFGSYPTYEEWKLCSSTEFSLFSMGSYPTYEEWKQLWDHFKTFSANKFLSYLWGMETLLHTTYLPFPIKGSYPTYEEWKQRLTVSSVAGRADVLILPMRNGNPPNHRIFTFPSLVLILPMRNGN